MNVQTALQFGGLISVIVGLASLLNGIMSIRRQMTLQIIMKYTERYEQIMSTFPESSLSFRVNACNLPQQDPALTVSVLKYLNLCSEEYYLRNKKYFAKNVWKIWELDMTRMLGSPLVRREWPSLKQEFDSHKEFAKYVEKIHADQDVRECVESSGNVTAADKA